MSQPSEPEARAAGAFRGEALTCRRGGRVVFSKLTFDLAAGRALVLVGPNGSGKSTLLRLMAGLLKAESGAMTWGGVDVHDDLGAHRARLCYAGHLDAVKPTQTVLDNLAFWACARGAARDEAESRSLDALIAFNLGPLADFPSNLLSAGQKRRLGLARLLLAPASLWLLDEPTVALDAASVETLIGLMRAHQESGGRIAISTHGRLAEPGALADATRLEMSEFAPPAFAFDEG